MHSSTLRRENKGDDETIQSQGFSENQDKNHSDKDLVLLCICSNTCVTYNSDSETGSLDYNL